MVLGVIVKLRLDGVVAANMQLIAGGVVLDHSTLTGGSLPIKGGA
ncbi:MAG: hypothetical protein ACRELF_17810 [Gemmataceae bacterium]